MTCSAQNANDINWLFNDIPLTTAISRITVNGGVLTINPVRLTDNGTYICKAGNVVIIKNIEVDLFVASEYLILCCVQFGQNPRYCNPWCKRKILALCELGLIVLFIVHYYTPPAPLPVRPSAVVSPSFLEVDLEDSAEFVCVVEAFPEPTVEWVELSTGAIVDPQYTSSGTPGHTSNLWS